jgi:CRP/FNR family cyclic AMP-dependent transcriptional regulator
MFGSNNKEIVRQLSEYPTFAECTQDDLAALVNAGAEFSLPAGWSLVQEGIPSDACYILMEGNARVFQDRHEIATMGPGDVVGEMTLLAGGQRRATVSSSTPIRGWRIENDALKELLSKRPHLKDALTAIYRSHTHQDSE